MPWGRATLGARTDLATETAERPGQSGLIQKLTPVWWITQVL